MSAKWKLKQSLSLKIIHESWKEVIGDRSYPPKGLEKDVGGFKEVAHPMTLADIKC